MNRIYDDAKDKNVAVTMAYADADDGNLFADSGKKTKLTKDEVFDLFLKGMIIFLGDEYFKPVTCKEESGAMKVTCVKDGGEAASMLNFYSSEHGAG